MDTFGQHLLVEYHGCDTEILNDSTRIETIMCKAAEAAQATVVASTFHRFSPYGISGVVVVEESHLSIHTWPECGYVAVDFFTCGECTPERAHDFIRDKLSAQRSEVMVVHRGTFPPGPSMQIMRHYHEGDDDTPRPREGSAHSLPGQGGQGGAGVSRIDESPSREG
ncbi:MAG: adenosylmethionine decarboxylase [Proteobacteria bacterium]|nr:adenosylmethionine decarboxylase [Pseudomonadota bacterium]